MPKRMGAQLPTGCATPFGPRTPPSWAALSCDTGQSQRKAVAMPSDAKGNVFQSRGRFFGRVSLGKGKRKAVLLPTCATQEQAEARAGFVADLVRQLRQAGKAEIVDLDKIIREAAEASSDRTLGD